MKARGFEPAVVVETSPDNFKALLDHECIAPHQEFDVASIYGSDPHVADKSLDRQASY
jgi:hypothetical protein